MQQPIHPPDIHEGAVVGDAPYDSPVDLVLRQRSQRLLPAPSARLLDGFLLRDDDALAAPIDLDYLHLQRLPNEAVERVHVAGANVGSREKAAQAQVNHEAPLDTVCDHGAQHLAPLVGLADAVPYQLIVGPLLGEHGTAVLVLGANDVDRHAIAHHQRLACLRAGR